MVTRTRLIKKHAIDKKFKCSLLVEYWKTFQLDLKETILKRLVQFCLTKGIN